MAIVIHDLGRNNVISVLEEDLRNGNCVIELCGDDNYVEIATPHLWGNPSITVCGNSTVRIGSGCVLAGLVVYAGPGSEISIGANTAFAGVTGIAGHEPFSIRIGAGCLFSAETHIMSSDMHSIIEQDTGRRINPARDVEIGPRVWLGFRAVVLKGSVIGEGAIIGAGSVVSGIIPPGCTAAGNPARAIRTGVTWTPALLPTGASLNIPVICKNLESP